VAELSANGIEAVDIPGEKSQFDVLRDGELVFSKQQEGRFPENAEVVELLS
jgi:predicted Rdx family selenoprotein